MPHGEEHAMKLSAPAILTLGLGALNLLTVLASDQKNKAAGTLWILAWTAVVVFMVEALYRRDCYFLSWFIALLPLILVAVVLIFYRDQLKKLQY